MAVRYLAALTTICIATTALTRGSASDAVVCGDRSAEKVPSGRTAEAVFCTDKGLAGAVIATRRVVGFAAVSAVTSSAIVAARVAVFVGIALGIAAEGAGTTIGLAGRTVFETVTDCVATDRWNAAAIFAIFGGIKCAKLIP